MDFDFSVGSMFDATASFPLDEDITTSVGLGGSFFVECYGPDGVLKWSDVAKNIIPNAVLNDILNVYFAAGSATAAFYCGMVDNAAFSAFAATDTMSSHAGWTESTAVSNVTRPAWTPGAAASASISNPSAMVFNINATATIKGFFLTSVNTLGGTSGNLDATAALSSPQPVANGDTLRVTYAINATTT